MPATQDFRFDDQLRAAIDYKTKPQGSLGRIEALAAQIARRQRSLTPRLATCRLVVFAADHGVTEAGVSAFPAAVTRQMVLNFANGAAAAMLTEMASFADAGVSGRL